MQLSVFIQSFYLLWATYPVAVGLTLILVCVCASFSLLSWLIEAFLNALSDGALIACAGIVALSSIALVSAALFGVF